MKHKEGQHESVTEGRDREHPDGQGTRCWGTWAKGIKEALQKQTETRKQKLGKTAPAEVQASPGGGVVRVG